MIDAHQHFWNYNEERDTWITPEMSVLRADFYPNYSEPLFREQGFTGCVAVQADSSEEETLFLLALAEQNEFIRGVVGWVDLQSSNMEDRLAYFSQFEAIKGFRHIVQGEKDPAFLARKEFIRGVKALASFDLSYDLLIYPHQITSAISFCQTCDDQRIVLDHLAKAPLTSGDISTWKKQIANFKGLDHVSAKISGIVTEAANQSWTQNQVNEVIEVALDVFGPQRLLLGSDYPVVLLHSTLERWVDTFQIALSSLSATEKDQIFEKNAIEFYQLETL
jgi:L-fuconolactonase